MGFIIGQNVGPYRVTDQLGSGGMATVYKAYHAALDRYVAIKVLHPAFKEDSTFLGRFQREARIVARLEHPHIVPIYDFNEHDGQPYLVMKFVEGSTLKARCASGRLSIPQVVEVMRPVCDALDYAHAQGILHRDIKPSNILITLQGGVFLSDFGLASIAQAGESTLSRDTMLGTPQYISPEQAQGQYPLDARTDIYSLGVVLYELLVGRTPYQADTPYAVIHDHIFTPLPIPTSLNPALPQPFERVLLKVLAKDRIDRYASAGELFTALRAAFDEACQAAGTGTGEISISDAKGSTVIRGSAPAAARAAASPASAPTIASGETAAPVSAFAPALGEGAGSTVTVATHTATSAVRVVEPAPSPARSSRNLWIWMGGGAAALILIAGLLLGGLLAMRAQRLGPPPGGPAQGSGGPLANSRAALHMQRARQFRDGGKIDQALGEYQAAAQIEPKLVDAYAEPGEMLLARAQVNPSPGPADLERAAQLFEQGLQQLPEDVRLRSGAARAWFMLNNMERAEPHLRWLMERQPDEPLPHAAWALVLVQRGQLDEAEAQALTALRLAPDSPEAHMAMGAVYLKKGQRPMALEQFKLAANSPQASRWLRDRLQKWIDEAK